MANPNLVKLVLPTRAGAQRRSRPGLLRDLLGGALLLATWLALWTVTWAAIAGPMSPADPLRRAEAVERAIAGS